MDQAFADAASRHGDAVPCRRGCSSCCHGIFEIHPPDAALLALGMEALEPEARSRVEARARAVVQRVAEAARLAAATEAALRGWSPGDGLATLPASAWARLAGLIEEACPLLDDEGACRLHAFRPAACRLQGLPWRDPETGAELPDFCRLDARQASLEPEPVALHALDQARMEARERLARTGEAGPSLNPGRTFVAEAIGRAAARPA